MVVVFCRREDGRKKELEADGKDGTEREVREGRGRRNMRMKERVERKHTKSFKVIDLS